MVRSGSLCGVMVALAQNARDVGLSPALGTIFPIFITPLTLVLLTELVQAMCCTVVEPTLCICKAIACIYVIVSIKRIKIPGGASVVVCTDL